MKRRSRLLRVAKWGGTTLSVALMIGSCLATPAVRYIWPWAAGHSGAGIWIGSAGIGYLSYVAITPPGPASWAAPEPIGWSVGEALYGTAWFGTEVGVSGVRVCGISSAFIAIVIGLPTVLLWYLDHRRSRLLPFAKWGGVVLCAAILAAWIGSGWLKLKCGQPTGYLVVESGILQVTHQVGNPPQTSRRFLFERSSSPGFLWRAPLRVRSFHHSTGSTTPTGQQPFRWTEHRIALPMWVPFVAAAAPISAVWWFGRRRRIPPGCCLRCRYNLTGLSEPRCPECGQPFELKGDPP